MVLVLLFVWQNHNSNKYQQLKGEYAVLKEQYETKKDVAMALTNNLMELKTNNYPEVGSPNRGDMPVTTHAGRDKNNKVSSLPDSDGSALNKLKNNKFVKNAVK